MRMEVLPRSSCRRGGVGESGDTAGGRGRFLSPIVGSEAGCSALVLDYWNCAHLCAHEFGYLCSDSTIGTSWKTTTESANWTISPSAHK